MKYLNCFDRRAVSAVGLSIAALISTAGCTTLQSQSRVDPQTIAVYAPGEQTDGGDSRCPARLWSDSNGGAINLDCFKFPNDSQGLAYDLAVADPGNTDRLASILLKHSDDVCTLEMGRLTANEATINTTLSILTTGFSAAASIVDGDTAQRILSGLATTSNASRGHINAEVYRNALSPVIARAIQGKRAELKQAIVNKLGVQNYSVDRMILDVNEYHQVCSFYYGLSLVVKAVDRSSFDSSDRDRAITVSLAETGLRLEDARRRIADGSISAEEKAALTTQRDALIAQQTSLLTERASPPAKTGN